MIDDIDVSPEFAAFIQAQEVAWCWYRLQPLNGSAPLPRFVWNEIQRCEAAWKATKAQEVQR